MDKEYLPSRDVETLIEIIRFLRSDAGCPWDRAQTSRSLVRYTLEEAYEVVEAVAQGHGYKICEELGDLLLQIALHSQIADEEGQFDFGDVVLAITSKLIRRHPHVFSDSQANTPAQVARLWAKVKEAEAADEKKSKVSPLPALLLLEKYGEAIDPAKVEDPLLRRLLILIQEAGQQNRCLEAEVQGIFNNFRLG